MQMRETERMQLIIMGMRYEVTTIDKAKITFSLEMVRIATRGQPKKNENNHIMWMWSGALVAHTPSVR
jgi:hypothetical protein